MKRLFGTTNFKWDRILPYTGSGCPENLRMHMVVGDMIRMAEKMFSYKFHKVK